MNKNKKLVTHDGSFHADDVFATAALAIYLEKRGEDFEIIRSRDEKIIQTGDYVYDVGVIYDADKNRFDHHQPGGAGKHDNGIEYASFGLVWKKFGEEVSGSAQVAAIIEKKLVSPIDAGDNAINLVEFKSDIVPYFIQNVFNAFYPSWENMNMETLYAGFMECVKIAKDILQREINHAKEIMHVREAVTKIYNDTGDKRIIVLDKRYPYEDILDGYNEPLFVIYPRADGLWGVKAQKKNSTSFENKKNFPASWAGLRDQELQKVTGVPEAIFCHRALFLAVANSLEGAVKLAQIAVQS